MGLAVVRHRFDIAGLALALALIPLAAPAADWLRFDVSGGDKALASSLEAASLLSAAQADGSSDPRDLLAAARADYARLVSALYAEGRYGGIVHIRVNGREAAAMSPFAVPSAINAIVVSVTPGPQFLFSSAEIAPLAPGSAPVAGYAAGEIAYSTLITDAATQAVSDWRDQGHAKAAVTGQKLVADHRSATLAADLTLTPGPVVTFGALVQTTPSAVRAGRIARIAGLPSGETFSPQALTAAAERLRRTGAFSSVVVTEADSLNPDGSMDIALAVADEKPRRFGAGAEVSSLDGLTISGFWLHRNLMGGAERLRLDGEVSGITWDLSGVDYSASAQLDVPAVFGTGIDGYLTFSADYINDPAYRLMQGGAEAGVSRVFTDRLDGTIGAAYRYEITDDDLGHREFSLVSLPATLTWDGRDNALNATSGLYFSADVEPFHDLAGGASGVHGLFDARSYLGLADDKLVLAGRVQLGAVLGAGATAVPPDYLFFSGGGGTVRGFPYQSLGVDIGGGDVIGGRAFLGLSGEARYKVTDTIGLVGFADAGHIGADTFFDGGGGWQIGAGVGLRYDTGIGPIRLDVALPVSGPGGDGVQLYLGIGQSF